MVNPQAAKMRAPAPPRGAGVRAAC